MDMRTPASMPRRFARSAGAFALAAGLLALALGGKLPTVAAQLTGQNKPPGDEPTKTISVQVRLIVEAVTVKDKSGKPIDGLSAKDFAITESAKLQTRFEFFNATNTPHFSNPNADLATSTTFGSITRTYGNMRIIQVAAKFIF